MILRIGLDINTPQKDILEWLIPRGPHILNSPRALNLTPPDFSLETPKRVLYWYLEPPSVDIAIQTIQNLPGVTSVDHVTEMDRFTREYILEDLSSIDALVLQYESRMRYSTRN